MNRLPARTRLSRVLPILSTSILAAAVPHLSAATFTWLDTNTGTLNWSAGAWNPLAPAAGDSLTTTDLIFNGSGATQYTANNDVANPFLLNTLTLNSTATVAQTIGGNTLSFNADGVDAAAITQSASGAFAIGAAINAVNPLTLGGAGTGLVSITGAVGGASLLTKTGGSTFFLNNIANNYSGGTTITGGVLEVSTSVANGAVEMTTGAASVLGTGALTINGGELKITQNGTGPILNATVSRNITFGVNGGTLNLNGRINNNAAATFPITFTPGGAAPVIKFNGGTNGISTNNPADGNWAIGASNSLRFSALTNAGATTPVIFEITNGAMMAW